MKHILFSLMLLIPLRAYTQITNVYNDAQFSLSRIYAGVNSTTLFPTDSMAGYANVNFRLGIMSSLNMSDKVVFKTWGAIQMSKNQPVAGYNSFEVILKPFQKWSFHAGLIATPMTVLRPNPTTWESQVETHAQSTIVPGRPGSKVLYSIDPKSSVTYGYFNHGEQWAHHLNITIYHWRVAGYRLGNGDYFTTLSFNRAWFENILTYSSKEELSTSAFVNFKNGLSFLIDTQYNFDRKDLKFLQTGIRKYVRATSVHLSGFFGLTYDWKTQAVIGQVFLHLS